MKFHFFYSDLLNLTFNQTFLNSSFDGKSVIEDIGDILQALRKYFHYEVAHIFVSNGKRSLDGFLEVSRDGLKKEAIIGIFS